jgi:ribonuclease E
MTEEAMAAEEQQEKKTRKAGTGARRKSTEEPDGNVIESAEPPPKPKRKPAVRKKKTAAEEPASPQEQSGEPAEAAVQSVAEEPPAPVAAEAEQAGKAPPEQKTPRKRGRQSKKDKHQTESAEAADLPATEEPSVPVAAEVETTVAGNDAAPEPKRSRKRGRRGKKNKMAPDAPQAEAAAEPVKSAEATEDVLPDEPEENKAARKFPGRLLINAEEPEECRIALVENGRLESFHVTTAVRERTKNNIYKGRIVSVEANLQAAFVEIGGGRNGFLPFSDIHPEYFREDISEQSRKLIREQHWRRLKIEDVISRGQDVLVQVVKEATGSKGANMTTFLSIPGRFLVLMPGSDSAGISRKISGEERRSELRAMMNGLSIPEGIGYIVRTASAEITQAALQQDLDTLLVTWEEIRQRGQRQSMPGLIHEDQDTVVRFLRDHFTPDIQEVIADTQDAFDQVSRFIATLPEGQRKVQLRLHKGSKPLFNQNNIEEQIESIYQPQVQLPSGGSIVINPTEALVAIDVNSGRTSDKGDFDKTIFLANMEAAEELARQLRLRDLGGLIVVDFIDMRNRSHIREVERQVKQALKRDKAKTDVSRISSFGLMQISRQKMGAPIEKGSYRTCPHCEGRGVIRSVETLALYYLRRIQTGVSRKKVNRVEARLPLEVGQYLLNRKRAELSELEERHQAMIEIILCPEMKPAENRIDFLV